MSSNKILIIYDSSRVNSVTTAMVTFKDTIGLALTTSPGIDAWVSSLTANGYAKIVVCVGDNRVEGSPGTGVIGDLSQANCYDLNASLFNDTGVEAGTAQAGGTTSITLDTNADAANDTYNGMF